MKITNKTILLILGLLLFLNISFSTDINTNTNIDNIRNITANSSSINLIEDNANLIDNQTELQINQILKDLYKSKKAEFRIITINSLNNVPIEMYSLNLSQGKIGFNNLNNGILLLISKEDREYRFEIGRGLESILTDSKMGKIGREYLVPNFKTQNYSEGILESTKIISKIINEKSISNIRFTKTSNLNNSNFYFLLIFFILIMFILNLFNSKTQNYSNIKNSKKNKIKTIKPNLKQEKIQKEKKGKFGGGGVTGKW